MLKTLGSKQHKALISILISKREATGLTQTQLADALGRYQSFIARLESGHRRVDVIEFLELSRILGFEAAPVIHTLEVINKD